MRTPESRLATSEYDTGVDQGSGGWFSAVGSGNSSRVDPLGLPRRVLSHAGSINARPRLKAEPNGRGILGLVRERRRAVDRRHPAGARRDLDRSVDARVGPSPFVVG